MIIVLNVDFTLQSDWFGNSLYDLIHADDVEKLREQLSTTESQNTGRILDLKSNRAFYYNSTALLLQETLYILPIRFVSLWFTLVNCEVPGEYGL